MAPLEMIVPTSIDGLEDEEFCYLTTTGRVSGRPHTIEIWFALSGATLFMLSGNGDRADWVRNARKEPHVVIRLGGRVFNATARAVETREEDALARRLVRNKYANADDELTDWARRSSPMAFDLDW